VVWGVVDKTMPKKPRNADIFLARSAGLEATPAFFTELPRRLIFSETQFIYSVHILSSYKKGV
jgi:hypothetical protein